LCALDAHLLVDLVGPDEQLVLEIDLERAHPARGKGQLALIVGAQQESQRLDELLLGALALTDVAHHGRYAGHAAALAYDRRERNGHVVSGSGLVDIHALALEVLSGPHALIVIIEFRPGTCRIEHAR